MRSSRKHPILQYMAFSGFRVGEPSHAGECIRQVGMRLHVIGLEPDRLLKADHGGIELSATGKREAEVVVNLRIIGSQPQRLFVTGHRLVNFAQTLEHDPRVVRGLGIFGPQPRGLPERDKGLVEPTLVQ